MSCNAEETFALLEKYENEARAIDEQVMEIAYYSNGGFPIDQCMNLSPRQRKYIYEMIKNQLEKEAAMAKF